MDFKEIAALNNKIEDYESSFVSALGGGTNRDCLTLDIEVVGFDGISGFFEEIGINPVIMMVPGNWTSSGKPELVRVLKMKIAQGDLVTVITAKIRDKGVFKIERTAEADFEFREEDEELISANAGGA